MFELTVDIDSEARPELCLGHLRVGVEIAVLPEGSRAHLVPRRPTRIAHRQSELSKLPLLDDAIAEIQCGKSI